MASLVNADKAALVRLATDRRRDMTLGSYGMPRELLTEILRERKNPDLFLAHESRWKPGKIFTDKDWLRETQGRTSDLYATLLQPNAIDHTLLGIIYADEHQTILFWLHRSAADGPFRPPESRTIDSLMPHLQRSIRQKLKFDHHDAALVIAEMVIDQAPFGLFILDRNAKILSSSHNAETFQQARDGISMKNRSLAFSDRENRQQFEELFSAAKRGGKDAAGNMKPFTVNKTAGNGTYQVGVRPMQLPARRGSLAIRNVVAVYVYDTSSRIPLNDASLRSLYKLTQAEAKVCGLLFRSYNLPDVARQLDISINTAKTHLNRSYRKVGVQSQAELVRKLAAQLYVG
jgi:DNA-binding CsgD family transcriptional regulator